jgi:hypothetical protein
LELAKKSVRNIGTLIVLIHFMVLLGHGAAHAHLQIRMTNWQSAFIAAVIFAAPLFAAVLLWTSMPRTGIYLLGGSMAASLFFGISYHFLAAGADNVFEMAALPWSATFGLSAALLAIVEAMACGWSVWVLWFAPPAENARIA